MFEKNVDNCINSLLEKLTTETANYKIRWKWFQDDSEKELMEKHNKYFARRLKHEFPYDGNDVLSDYPENYQIIASESMFIEIRYKTENKKKRKLRFGLIKGVFGQEQPSDKSNYMLSLVCDRKHHNFYVPLITSNHNSDDRKRLNKLYYLAEFKMDKEIKIIEKWLLGEYEKTKKGGTEKTKE